MWLCILTPPPPTAPPPPKKNMDTVCCAVWKKKYGHGLLCCMDTVCCAVLYFRCITHLSTFMWFLYPYSSALLRWWCGGIQSKAYFQYFHHKLLTKSILISLVFHVDWYKLTSKPSEANSGTYANIYQGFILNLGLNHMQYAVFTSNQTKNMWFVPLIRNMNCAITYIYVRKKLSC